MELVYLWVEDYKNIKKQGFNFSPRFNCKFYDEYEVDEEGNEKLKDDCKLEINKKDDYVNIFPENINVTAIVGENGSGKTGLVKFINEHYTHDTKKILIYCVDEKLVLLHNFNRDGVCAFLESNKKYILMDIKYDEKASFLIHRSSLVLGEFDFTKSYTSCNLTNTSYMVYKNDNDDVQFILNLLSKTDINIPFKTPEFISIDLLYNEEGIKKLKNSIQYYIKKHRIKVDFIASDLFYEDSLEYKIYELKFYFLAIYIHLHYTDLSGVYFNIVHEFNKITPKNLKELIKVYVDSNYISISIIQKIDNIANFVTKNLNKKYTYGFDVRVTNIPSKLIEDYNYLTSKIDNHNKKSIDLIGFSFSEKISSGEYQFLLLFAQIYEYFKNKYILFIDEGDVFLHPNWQKKYIQYLVEFIKTNFNPHHYHLILTSHSPFILSDLPKCNVVFLKGGKQVEVDIDTFGANIHTLLSHGFFMEDGLMGEFAKEKIQDVIYFLNNDKKSKIETKEDAWKIIQIIGEPFLKYKLEEKFHENYSSDKVKNEAKIKRLKQEIERLENVKPKD